MRTKIKYGILFAVPILFFLVGFYHVEEPHFLHNSDGDDQIEYKGYFPKMDVPIATTALAKVKAHPSENLVAVIEQRPSTVYLFEKDGTYIDEVGGKGRGPAEYSMANGVFLVNEKIVLNDVGNGKIIAFSDNKEEVFSFIPDFIPANILSTEEGVLLFPYYNQMGDREAYMYTLYTASGDEVGGYGEIPDELREMSSFPQLNIDLFDSGIYMLPYPSTTVYRYGIKEHPYEPIELKGRDYSGVFGQIKNAFPEVDEEQITNFVDIKVNEGGIFVSIFHVGLIIDHYDLNGNYIQTFDFDGTYEDEELSSSPVDRYLRSFDMTKLDNERYRLYGAVSSSYARILMFDIQL